MFEDRPPVDCPIAERCGGCAIIHMSYGDQLAWKRGCVRDAVATENELRGVELDPCLPANRREEYRNRAKLAVVQDRGEVRIGLYRRESNQVEDLAPCRVQGRISLGLLDVLRAWLARHRLAAPVGPVKFVDLREAVEGGCHVTLVLAVAPDAPLDWPWRELTEAIPGLVGLSVNYNPRASSYVFGAATRTVWGTRTFMAPFPSPEGQAASVEVPATGFLQVATDLFPAIHVRMREHLRGAGPVHDLFCGVGVHGLAVVAGSEAGDLVGVEENPAATACARRNAHRRGIAARYHTGRVERVWPPLAASTPPRGIILNPGRPGCRPAVLDGLSALRSGRMAYVSCNPSTLARDLAALVRGGWSVDRVTPVDLMPQTDQVETLALLSR